MRFDPDGCIYNRSSAARQFCDESRVCSPRLRLPESCIHDDEHQVAEITIVVTNLRTDVEVRSITSKKQQNGRREEDMSEKLQI